VLTRVWVMSSAGRDINAFLGDAEFVVSADRSGSNR
jgi:hypothetical protein